MTQGTISLLRKLVSCICLCWIITACEHGPPFGQIYSEPEYEIYTQLAPINDTDWVSIGSRHLNDEHRSVGLYKYMNAEFETVWEKSYAGEVFEMGSKMISIRDGYMLLGYTKFSDERDGDCRVARVDTLGKEIWNSIIGGVGNDHLYGVVASRDSGYLLVGSTARDRSVGINGWLVKLDSIGEQMWTRSFGHPESIKGDFFSSIQSVPTGGYLISGYTASFGAGRYDGWLVKIDEGGNEEWSRTYGGEGKDFIGQPLLLDHGGFLIAGGIQPLADGKKMGWLFKLDSLGSEVWSKYYEDVSQIKSLVPFQSDGYLMLGNLLSIEDANSDIWLCRIDKWGEKVWDKVLGGKERDHGLGIYVIDSGYRIIASTNSFGNNWVNWIIDLDSEGNL